MSGPAVVTKVLNPLPAQPADVLVQLDWEGGFTRFEVSRTYGRVPEFTLLPDGTAVYGGSFKEDRAQVMVAHLAPAETEALLNGLVELGIERLESYTDECQEVDSETCLCVEDAGQSILRVHLPGQEPREIRNTFEFANDPEALRAIRALLSEYRHPEAVPYAPGSASLFIQPLPASYDLPALDWPLDPAWLAAGTTDMPCVRAVSGDDLQALLAVTGSNAGDFGFRAGSSGYNLYLVPWLPGVDYAEAIATSEQACPVH